MNYVRVKNFSKYQHYKDRSPPWIKLYNDLLDDYNFSCLQDASKSHLILIWLLASRTGNEIPADPEWIRSRIGARDNIDLHELVDSGFLIADQPLQRSEQVASTPLASRKHVARPEREGETEGERDSEPDGSGVAGATAKPMTVYDTGSLLIADADGTNPRAARTFIAKLCRDHGELQVTAAIHELRERSPPVADPKSFLVAMLKGKPNGQHRASRHPNADAASRLDAFEAADLAAAPPAARRPDA